MRRTIQNNRHHRTSDISTKYPGIMENPQGFHVSLLRQYKETEVYGANYARPLLEIEEEMNFMKLSLF